MANDWPMTVDTLGAEDTDEAITAGRRPGRRWGEAIKRFREKRGWSQTRLAEIAGLSKTQVSEIETRGERISPDALEEIARALGVRVADIVSDEQSPESDLRLTLAEATYDFAISCRGTPESWGVLAQDLGQYVRVFEAMESYRRLVHQEMVHFQLRLQRLISAMPVEEVDPRIVEAFTRIFSEPLAHLDPDSSPRAWLLYQLGRLRMLFGLLAAVNRLAGDQILFFDHAATAFKESLRIKRRLGLRAQQIIPTETRLLEVFIERLLVDTHHTLGGSSERIAKLQQLLPKADSLLRQLTVLGDEKDRATRDAKAQCYHLLARIHYELGKQLSPRDGKEVDSEPALEAYGKAEKFCEDSRECKDSLQDHDGVLWANVLNAKITRRAWLIRKASGESPKPVAELYLKALSVDPLRLCDLRSICVLETLYRDILENRDEGWVNEVLENIGYKSDSQISMSSLMIGSDDTDANVRLHGQRSVDVNSLSTVG